MKKPIRILAGLALALVLAGVCGVLFVDSLVRRAIERGGSSALGVETRVEEASVGIVSGRFELDGLAVANPPGFGAPSFFALRTTRLELSPASLLSERVILPELILEGITLDLERNAQGTNYGVILDHLSKLESGSKQGGGSEPSADSGPQKVFVLQKLVLRDVRAVVDFALPGSKDSTKLSLTIPELVVTDLASDMTLAQICSAVVQTVVRAAIQQGGQQLPAELLADLRGRMDGLADQARARFETELGKAAEKLGPEAERALHEAESKLGEKLGGVLKKKK